MNNPNPFVPKGSLLEQQSQRRSRLKLTVFCVLAVSVTGLMAMLIQGCHRETPTENNALPIETNPPPLEMTNTAVVDTNPAPALGTTMTPATNPLPPVPIAPVPTVTTPPTETPAVGTEYVVVANDTLGKIAKAHGVTVKALEAANPGVDPKKLKPKQKLVIPAATAGVSATAPTGTTPAAAATEAGGETYVVKSNDNLSKIAKKHGVTVKALKAANNMNTDHIKVGEKLKIPAKAETVAPTPSPAATETSAPVVQPVTTPVPPTTPTPGH